MNVLYRSSVTTDSELAAIETNNIPSRWTMSTVDLAFEHVTHYGVELVKVFFTDGGKSQVSFTSLSNWGIGFMFKEGKYTIVYLPFCKKPKENNIWVSQMIVIGK